MGAEEKYMEWLEREEEVLGLDATVRASEDIEYARVLLEEELGYTPSDEQLEAFQGAAAAKYELLPEASINVTIVEQTWGEQVLYRDIITGHFVSYEDVKAALDELRER